MTHRVFKLGFGYFNVERLNHHSLSLCSVHHFVPSRTDSMHPRALDPELNAVCVGLALKSRTCNVERVLHHLPVEWILVLLRHVPVRVAVTSASPYAHITGLHQALSQSFFTMTVNEHDSEKCCIESLSEEWITQNHPKYDVACATIMYATEHAIIEWLHRSMSRSVAKCVQSGLIHASVQCQALKHDRTPYLVGDRILWGHLNRNVFWEQPWCSSYARGLCVEKQSSFWVDLPRGTAVSLSAVYSSRYSSLGLPHPPPFSAFYAPNLKPHDNHFRLDTVFEGMGAFMKIRHTRLPTMFWYLRKGSVDDSLWTAVDDSLHFAANWTCGDVSVYSSQKGPYSMSTKAYKRHTRIALEAEHHSVRKGVFLNQKVVGKRFVHDVVSARCTTLFARMVGIPFTEPSSSHRAWVASEMKETWKRAYRADPLAMRVLDIVSIDVALLPCDVRLRYRFRHLPWSESISRVEEEAWKPMTFVENLLFATEKASGRPNETESPVSTVQPSILLIHFAPPAGPLHGCVGVGMFRIRENMTFSSGKESVWNKSLTFASQALSVVGDVTMVVTADAASTYIDCIDLTTLEDRNRIAVGEPIVGRDLVTSDEHVRLEIPSDEWKQVQARCRRRCFPNEYEPYAKCQPLLTLAQYRHTAQGGPKNTLARHVVRSVPVFQPIVSYRRGIKMAAVEDISHRIARSKNGWIPVSISPLHLPLYCQTIDGVPCIPSNHPLVHVALNALTHCQQVWSLYDGNGTCRFTSHYEWAHCVWNHLFFDTTIFPPVLSTVDRMVVMELVHHVLFNSVAGQLWRVDTGGPAYWPPTGRVTVDSRQRRKRVRGQTIANLVRVDCPEEVAARQQAGMYTPRYVPNDKRNDESHLILGVYWKFMQAGTNMASCRVPLRSSAHRTWKENVSTASEGRLALANSLLLTRHVQTLRHVGGYVLDMISPFVCYRARKTQPNTLHKRAICSFMDTGVPRSEWIPRGHAFLQSKLREGTFKSLFFTRFKCISAVVQGTGHTGVATWYLKENQNTVNMITSILKRRGSGAHHFQDSILNNAIANVYGSLVYEIEHYLARTTFNILPLQEFEKQVWNRQ